MEQSLDKLKELQDPNELVSLIEKMFEKFDEDGNLLLDRDELFKFVQEFFEMFNVKMNLNEGQLTACFQEIDINGDGVVQPSELQKFASKYVQVLLQAFESVLENEREKPFDDDSRNSSRSSSSSSSLKTDYGKSGISVNRTVTME